MFFTTLLDSSATLFTIAFCGSYLISSSSMRSSITDQYLVKIGGLMIKFQKNNGQKKVQINDVVFALHALVLSSIVAIQCLVYEVTHKQTR